ncbi:MAG: glucose 1-dehydrogenase [Pseudomonadota bacterium]|jgi:3alpha(or 20beta)-hydroxysteroid dehydrogenase
MSRLQGKVAIITGAARGQGEATARLFAAEGCAVVMTDILTSEGEAIAASIGERALFVHHDVSDEGDWAKVVEAAVTQFGKVDILVNNAAIPFFNPIENTTGADLIRLFTVNSVGTFLGIKAVLTLMKEARSGSIVNISSINGLRGTSGMSAYDMCKWATRGLTKSVALEAAAFNVRVNSVHPGAIDTPMLNPTSQPAPEKLALDLGIPFRRVGQPAEVAAASLFLASDEASYISGAELSVDGAWSSGLSTNIQELEEKG